MRLETCASHMCLYISQSVGNALHARTISLGSAKTISNTIARSIDLRQNIASRKSAQQRRHVDAKQRVRNASARNKLKQPQNKMPSFVFIRVSCFVVLERVVWLRFAFDESLLKRTVSPTRSGSIVMSSHPRIIIIKLWNLTCTTGSAQRGA